MSEIRTRKCPLCGGTMVMSKTGRAGYARFFWTPPWKSRLTGTLKPVIEATPLALPRLRSRDSFR